MDVKKKIIELREKKGWSQYKLHKEAGIGQSTISQIESGTRYPNTATLQKIAKALGVSMAEFDGSNENKKEAALLLPQIMEELNKIDLNENQRNAYSKILSMTDGEKQSSLEEFLLIYKKFNSLPQEEKQAVGDIINFLARK